MVCSAIVAAVAMAGCTSAKAVSPHELRIALDVDPASLSPLIAFSQDQIAYDQLWCQTLVGLDERNRFIPILVTRLPSRANGDVSPDGTRITYHLRRDVRFADGVPFTAADVAFTYRAIFEPRNNASGIDAYKRIASLTTPDVHTVVIHLRKPWNAAVHVLFAQADFAYGILPKHAFADARVSGTPWDRKPFGTGPFQVAFWHRGDRIALEPNRYYRPKPKLTRLVLRIITNPTSEFIALRTHETDVATLSAANVDEAARIAGVRVVRIAENGLVALYLQTVRQPTSDIRLRRALAYALDPQALGKAWRGLFPAASSIFPAPLVTWAAAMPPPFPHDLGGAARELDAAGWRLRGGVRTKNGLPLTLLVVANGDSLVGPRTLIVVQERLAHLGIGVTIKVFPSEAFTAPSGPLRTGQFSLTYAALIGGSDPEQSINLQCSQARDGGENYSRYCSPRLETLFDNQARVRNETQRGHELDAIAHLVREDVPLIPLFDEIYFEGIATRVKGYAKNMLRYPVAPEDWDAS
jgi:peptide/nickel transport system substrate-binding protein